jgi:hypothetical protein
MTKKHAFWCTATSITRLPLPQPSGFQIFFFFGEDAEDALLSLFGPDITEETEGIRLENTLCKIEPNMEIFLFQFVGHLTWVFL